MMRITVTGRQTDVGDSLREYVDKKVSKFERYYDRVHSVDVIFDVEGGSHRCEIIVKADHHNMFVAKENQEEIYASLDAAVKDLERQLTRHKEKYRNRKHLTGRNSDNARLGGTASESSPGDMQTEQPEGEAS